LGARLVAYPSGVKETARADGTGRWPAGMTCSGCDWRTRLSGPSTQGASPRWSRP